MVSDRLRGLGFMGTATLKEAEHLLVGRQPGAYVVRKSPNRNEIVAHILLPHPNGNGRRTRVKRFAVIAEASGGGWIALQFKDPSTLLSTNAQYKGRTDMMTNLSKWFPKIGTEIMGYYQFRPVPIPRT